MKPVNVGIVGCGNISEVYLKVAKTFPILNVVAVADIIPERAKAKAEAHGIPKVLSTEHLIADPDIDIVVNLTIPKTHGEIGIAALEAGKSVYNEKPLAPTRQEAQEMFRIAEEKGLFIGGAPDTFLGAGIQTCRKLIDDGWVGEPVAATAFWGGHGHERWHPDPEFFYKPGGGPMFDMGPYYLTALVTLVGPVKTVASSARITFSERTITSQAKFGQTIKVETPTHITGTLEFANGAIGTMLTSFDVWAHTLPHIELHGTTGSLRVPDPNQFGGPVFVRRAGAQDWTQVPHTHGYAEQNRSIGVADMAYAIRTGRKHRANGALTYHVLDIMHAFLDSSRERKHVDLASTCERPKPLPMDLMPGSLDE